MTREKKMIEVDEELFTAIKCLAIALMDKYCPKGEFVLTKEQRKELVGRISMGVQRKTMDNLDDKYWLT